MSSLCPSGTVKTRRKRPVANTADRRHRDVAHLTAPATFEHRALDVNIGNCPLDGLCPPPLPHRTSYHLFNMASDLTLINPDRFRAVPSRYRFTWRAFRGVLWFGDYSLNGPGYPLQQMCETELTSYVDRSKMIFCGFATSS